MCLPMYIFIAFLTLHRSCLFDLLLMYSNIKGHKFVQYSDVFFFFFNLPKPSNRTRPWVYSASNRNEYQKHKNMFLGSRARPTRKADNLTAICEPTA
jgi:hypothetical protein